MDSEKIKLGPASLFAQFARKKKKDKTSPVVETNRRKIFGASIEEIMKEEKEEIPLVVRHMIEYFVTETMRSTKKSGLYKKGLFRQCGSQRVIDAVIERYENDDVDPRHNPFIEEKIDIHVCGSLFKQFLRHLKEPLISPIFENTLIKYWEELEPEESIEQNIQTRQFVQRLVSYLGPMEQRLLNLTCYLLYWTDQFNPLMKAQQLARVFCQVIMDKSSVSMIKMPYKVRATEFLIKFYPDIFDAEHFDDDIMEFFPLPFHDTENMEEIGEVPTEEQKRRSIRQQSMELCLLPTSVCKKNRPKSITKGEPPKRCTPQTPVHTFFYGLTPSPFNEIS